MNYVLYKNKNSKSKAFGKYYARASYAGFKNTEDLCNDIEKLCTATSSDVKAVIDALIYVMGNALRDSYKVQLDGLGIFKVGLTSTGVENVDDFSAVKNIVGSHVNFLPSVKIDSATGARRSSLLTGIKIRETAKNSY